MVDKNKLYLYVFICLSTRQALVINPQLALVQFIKLILRADAKQKFLFLPYIFQIELLVVYYIRVFISRYKFVVVNLCRPYAVSRRVRLHITCGGEWRTCNTIYIYISVTILYLSYYYILLYYYFYLYFYYIYYIFFIICVFKCYKIIFFFTPPKVSNYLLVLQTFWFAEN